MSFNRVKQMSEVQQEALDLFTKKNSDYGDSFATYGPIGVIVRMQDKINRLVSVSTKCVCFVNDESLRDTLIDLHNYSAMAVMLMDEKDDNKSFSVKEEISSEIGQPKKISPEQDVLKAFGYAQYYGFR